MITYDVLVEVDRLLLVLLDEHGSHNQKSHGHGHGVGQSHNTNITLTPTGGPMYKGRQVPTTTKLTKQQSGALGERIALEYLKGTSQASADASPLNSKQNNYPIDGLHDSRATEIKTGLISNSPGAHQWRVTLGQPGKETTAWLKSASPAEKAAYNQRKQHECHERKEKAMKEVGAALGRDLKSQTVATIINPDTKTADVFVFDGFHDRISWRSPQASAGYVGTYNYKERG